MLINVLLEKLGLFLCGFPTSEQFVSKLKLILDFLRLLGESGRKCLAMASVNLLLRRLSA